MRMTKERWATLCFWLLFALMLVVGRYTYQDYGITMDEDWERTSTGINYQYVYEKVTGEKLNLFDTELHDYRERYYGVALQMPMMVLEHLTGFTMPARDGFMLRHLYTFCLCMGGWFCFYHFCRLVFRNRWLALAGMLMAALYPRFWGEQFNNIKDMVFCATACASMLGVALCLEHEGKWRYDLLAAVFFAVCANTRVIGFMFPALLFGYRLLRDLAVERKVQESWKRWLKKDLLRYLFNVVLMFAVYFLISPASWRNPLDFLKNVFLTFSNYTTWTGVVPFLDQMYPGNQLPGHYLVTWVLISAPLWYLLCMAWGLADGVRCFIAELKQKRIAQWLLGDQRYLLFCLVVAGLPLMLPFLKEVTLYNSWRHMYFVFPALVVLALFGMRAIWRMLKNRKALRMASVVAVCALLGLQVGWIAWNHPYEKVYFNPVGRQVADTVDRDYWGESSYEALQVILENDDEKRISITSDWLIGITVFGYLPPEQMNRFYVYYNSIGDVDYYIDAADTVEPQMPAGYTPVHERRMKDGLLLYTLFIRDDVLQERFDGVYPGYNIQP